MITAAGRGPRPAVGGQHLLVQHEPLGQLTEQGQALRANGVPVMGVATWQRRRATHSHWNNHTARG